MSSSLKSGEGVELAGPTVRIVKIKVDGGLFNSDICISAKLNERIILSTLFSGNGQILKAKSIRLNIYELSGL